MAITNLVRGETYRSLLATIILNVIIHVIWRLNRFLPNCTRRDIIISVASILMTLINSHSPSPLHRINNNND